VTGGDWASLLLLGLLLVIAGSAAQRRGRLVPVVS
jgi:hypothetical protein